MEIVAQNHIIHMVVFKYQVLKVHYGGWGIDNHIII